MQQKILKSRFSRQFLVKRVEIVVIAHSMLPNIGFNSYNKRLQTCFAFDAGNCGSPEARLAVKTSSALQIEKI